MHYRFFKGIKISEVGLGTWQLGSADWGVVKDNEAFSILKTFSDGGGNFIDTSDVYGMGISERLVGKFLSTTDKQIFVATKLGRRQDADSGWPQNFTYDLMRRHVESSLKNLNVSKLFLEQLHCIPKEQLKSGKVFDNLRKLQEEKLIQFWGASVETTEEALICLEQKGLASLQIIFNLFRQHVAEEIFSRARQRDVALIIRVPLASGLLTGGFNQQTRFASSDHRNFNANGEAFNAGETFSGIEFSNGVNLAKEIAVLLPDKRMAEWSIRWILDHPQVTTVIPGATKAEQVKANIVASDLPPLDPQTHQKLRALYEKNIRPAIRGHY
jgi:aryl-alcohol dehydrogenase-like predicted oxidoreductase